jgi:hypothetical protein
MTQNRHPKLRREDWQRDEGWREVVEFAGPCQPGAQLRLFTFTNRLTPSRVKVVGELWERRGRGYGFVDTVTSVILDLNKQTRNPG